jgi:hypothetical protein
MQNRSGANTALVFAAMVVQASLSTAQAQAPVTAYPALPGLTTSPDFTVNVNGVDVWVEKLGPGTAVVLEDLNIANFACSGPMTITVSARIDISSYTIRPRSRGISAELNGRELTFTIPGPPTRPRSIRPPRATRT